ncbi:MAG: nucleoside deaminase [Alphaproteobacteria bacterium]|nr:nucleoside deaminase [Alphaproteobacteria bacterium]
MDYNTQDIERLREAIKLSASFLSSPNHLDGGPFGAVIYQADTCIAKGWNHVLSAPDATAHAEVTAIREACKNLQTFDLSGCVLYSSCEPCPMCLMAAKWANISRIFFAATREDAAAIGFRDDELYKLLKDGVYATPIEECSSEAAEVMSQWYSSYASTAYY